MENVNLDNNLLNSLINDKINQILGTQTLMELINNSNLFKDLGLKLLKDYKVIMTDDKLKEILTESEYRVYKTITTDSFYGYLDNNDNKIFLDLETSTILGNVDKDNKEFVISLIVGDLIVKIPELLTVFESLEESCINKVKDYLSNISEDSIKQLNDYIYNIKEDFKLKLDRCDNRLIEITKDISDKDMRAIILNSFREYIGDDKVEIIYNSLVDFVEIRALSYTRVDLKLGIVKVMTDDKKLKELKIEDVIFGDVEDINFYDFKLLKDVLIDFYECSQKIKILIKKEL